MRIGTGMVKVEVGALPGGLIRRVVTLFQVLLDPFYRTIAGFAVLIEKDWLAFGHMFARRCGHGVPEYNDDNRSPVFLQFMDCLWQVCRPLSIRKSIARSCGHLGRFVVNSRALLSTMATSLLS